QGEGPGHEAGCEEVCEEGTCQEGGPQEEGRHQEGTCQEGARSRQRDDAEPSTDLGPDRYAASRRLAGAAASTASLSDAALSAVASRRKPRSRPDESPSGEQSRTSRRGWSRRA